MPNYNEACKRMVDDLPNLTGANLWGDSQWTTTTATKPLPQGETSSELAATPIKATTRAYRNAITKSTSRAPERNCPLINLSYIGRLAMASKSAAMASLSACVPDFMTRFALRHYDGTTDESGGKNFVFLLPVNITALVIEDLAKLSVDARPDLEEFLEVMRTSSELAATPYCEDSEVAELIEADV